jgi:AcrR family transcriptional regulator
MSIVRARQAHQKEARRQDILAVGRTLFTGGRFEELTMAQVAQAAGLAKGTVFLYFKTKEALFLELTEEALLEFFEALDAGLSSGRLFFGPEELAALVGRCYKAQPQLPRLLSLLHPVLEHNVDRLRLLAFKEFLANRSARTGRILEQRLTFLREGEGVPLLLRLHALTIGCWELGNPSPVVREVLDSPGLEAFKVSFIPFFLSTFSALVAGLEEQSRRKK